MEFLRPPEYAQAPGSNSRRNSLLTIWRTTVESVDKGTGLQPTLGGGATLGHVGPALTCLCVSVCVSGRVLELDEDDCAMAPRTILNFHPESEVTPLAGHLAHLLATSTDDLMPITLQFCNRTRSCTLVVRTPTTPAHSSTSTTGAPRPFSLLVFDFYRVHVPVGVLGGLQWHPPLPQHAQAGRDVPGALFRVAPVADPHHPCGQQRPGRSTGHTGRRRERQEGTRHPRAPRARRSAQRPGIHQYVHIHTNLPLKRWSDKGHVDGGRLV